jgi:hypothetical protein
VRGEDAVRNRAGLVVGVAAGDQRRPGARLQTVGDEPQPQFARAHLVRKVEDRLRGTEVAFKAHQRGVGVRRHELEQVPGARPPERVDRLCVIADNREPAAVGTEPAHDVDLKLVDILILVDEHPVPARPKPRSDIGISD